MNTRRLIPFLSLFSVATLIADHHGAHAPKLELLWETEAALKVPESVRFDAARKVLYVANIDGKEPWGEDGLGSIGKVGLDGKVIDAEWIKGLNAPKGMGLYGKFLYVADLTKVVVIDVDHDAIVDTIAIADSVGLNDVSADESGTIFVTDSKAGSVYRIENGKTTRIVSDLKKLNGVLASQGELYLVHSGGLYKTTPTGGEMALIADGMEGGTDGIERVDNKTWLVTCWAGVTYLVTPGTATKLLDTREQKINSADLAYDPATKTAYLPTFWNNTVQAYRLK